MEKSKTKCTLKSAYKYCEGGYCCFYCERKQKCFKACENVPEKCRCAKEMNENEE